MLERLALGELVEWKRQAARKPLLLDGARQVGKSWLVGRIFGPREFRNVHWLDFRAEPRLEHPRAQSALLPVTHLDKVFAREQVERAVLGT